MKGSVHVHLNQKDRAVLEKLMAATGQSESEIVRRGLELVAQEVARGQSALDLAGRSVGRFKNGARDLSSGREHLERFGA